MALTLTWSWSASKAAFFPNELKSWYTDQSTWPSDALAVSDAVYAAAFPSTPDGKMLGADAQGNPARVPIPAPAAS